MRRFFFALLLLTGGTLWANGDPVATFCALTLSRNPIGVHVPEVQLKYEHLTVTPEGRYTLVRVEYLLYNNSKKDFANLPYGFPIDYYRHGSERWASLDGNSESVAEVGWRDDYITEVAFTLNGIQLPYYALYEYESDLLRRWYYTRLNIPAGKAVKLVVQYRVENSCTVSLPQQDAQVSQPRGHCRFAYDFSPASYWGNGKAETFAVLVDVSQVRSGRNLEDTSSCVPHGLSMRKIKGDRWHYTSRNFDLAKAEPLSFYYWFENEPAHLTDLFNHRISPDRYTVEVSGSDPKYPAANLSDMDLGTTAVLLPDKADSLHITVHFKQPTKVKTIVFYNGYCKSPAGAHRCRRNHPHLRLLRQQTCYRIVFCHRRSGQRQQIQ